jgi:quercetin dioxygenase-like cupin family protein
VITRVGLVAVASLVAGPALAAEGEVFDLAGALGKADRQRPAVNRFLVRASEYTVSAVAVNDEIPTHRHEDGNHVLYIVSGRGTATVDGKAIALKPGLLLHIPKGVTHSIRAQGGQMTFVDFIQHAADPGAAERK